MGRAQRNVYPWFPETLPKKLSFVSLHLNPQYCDQNKKSLAVPQLEKVRKGER
jgi:hypothetical protein